MIRNTLPLGLMENPRLDQWIGFEEPGHVRIATGKVELGQGILTALVQIAADELDVAPARIKVVSGDTAVSPSEGFTAGSLSIENSGGSVRLVAAEARAMMLEAAAKQLGCETDDLAAVDGQIRRNGAETGLDYWHLASSLDFAKAATGSAPLKTIDARKWIGTSLPRMDLAAKVFGGTRPFIHDMPSPDLVHARVLRQPWSDAELVGPDAPELTKHCGPDVRIVRIANFVAVVAETERAATVAANKLAARLQWSGGRPHVPAHGETGWIAEQPSIDSVTEIGSSPTQQQINPRVRRKYSKPFLSHASIGPSCALALFANEHLTVWTHSQGVVPLRGALAKALELSPDKIRAMHLPGAGCYGHNGADDAACDAAIIALRTPGKTVRVQWSREDELSSSPLGTAMVVAIDAEISSSGYPLSWTTEIWGGSHVQRPGVGGTANLLGAYALPNPPPRPAAMELPAAAGGSGMRNATLLYDVPHQKIVNHVATDLIPRTSSMRGLGAFANVFAIESFIDELAKDAGIDALAFRLKMTPDPRARTVMERAVEMAGGLVRPDKSEGRGRGFAYSRYKNRAGYLALVVDVGIDDEVRLERIWCAVDCGLAINPDGVRNQVEGGIIQSASWTLKEQVLFDEGRIASRDWDTYPILKFSEVPEIEIALIDRPNDPTLGVGEVSQGPTAAAIANAVADALGVRIRDLPLTRARIIEAMS
jgi:nicotinate dehydrogenase subunit B